MFSTETDMVAPFTSSATSDAQENIPTVPECKFFFVNLQPTKLVSTKIIFSKTCYKQGYGS